MSVTIPLTVFLITHSTKNNPGVDIVVSDIPMVLVVSVLFPLFLLYALVGVHKDTPIFKARKAR